MSDQERFDELFKRGYKNLDAPTRVEYQALKKKLAGEKKAEDKPQPTKPDSDDRIARLERLVESLTSENDNLREETAKMQEGWAEYKPPKDANQTATLKVYREDADSEAGVITKLETFKQNAFNEETRKNDLLIYKIEVTYDDASTKEFKINAMDFAEMKEVEKVEIVKEDRRTLKKVEDYAVVPNTDKDGFPKRVLDGGTGYGQNVGSQKVPLEVYMVKSTVVVKRPNGQEITMEADYLNI